MAHESLSSRKSSSRENVDVSDDFRWMFVVRALHKPGTLTDAASVFSNRGVSLEGFLGSGIDTRSVEDGRLLLSFRATTAKKNLLKRSLQRLPSVSQVNEYAFDDDRLRLVAVVKLSLEAQVKPTEHLHVEIISRGEESWLVLFTGRAMVVESAITRLRQQQHLQDVVVSAITV